jgi:hypothetical protein
MTVMQKLAAMIEERLKKRAFCLVFDPELQRCWPLEKMDSVEREREIEAFARSRGWHVAVLPVESGTRAIFQERAFRPATTARLVCGV